MLSPTPQSTPRFTFRRHRSNGATVTGPVRGNGGMVTSIDQLFAARRVNALGRPHGLYAPKPGCVAVFPDYCAAGDGEPVVVSIVAPVFCDCDGCLRSGQGSCGCLTCSECSADSAAPLETLDTKDGENGPRPFRPCPTCLVSMPAGDIDAVLDVCLGGELAAVAS